jgi:hypothetical protein
VDITQGNACFLPVADDRRKNSNDKESKDGKSFH